MNAFDPSSRAPSAPGPKTSLPCARRSSASPSTRGCSGPTTNRSASMASAGVSTDPGMPGLPGVTTTSAVRASTIASACSRPPDPTTQTFTGENLEPAPGISFLRDRRSHAATTERSAGELDVLVAGGTHAEEADRHTALVGQELDVGAGVGREVVRLGGFRHVGLPTGQPLVDRGALVDHRLVVGTALDALAFELVGQANLHRVEAV